MLKWDEELYTRGGRRGEARGGGEEGRGKGEGRQNVHLVSYPCIVQKKKNGKLGEAVDVEATIRM